MILTNEMKDAFDMIEKTDQCLFITGKAGSGKTTFLKYIVENTKKNYAITASTGVAAINCNGATLHSLFGIPFGIQSPDMPMQGKIHQSKIHLFKELQLLIIDEISMVRPDIIDCIDRKLRLYRMNNLPFGGVQIVMFGDLYQLPPVVTPPERKILNMSYAGEYFYYALVWKQCPFKLVELTQVFRQRDPKFVKILNNIREYKTTWTDIQELDTVRDRRAAMEYDNNHIHLCVFKNDAEKINKKMLGEPTHSFKATYTGDFNPKSAPCDDTLLLRLGARVIMVANDPNKLYYNGSMGVVEEISQEAIGVRLDDGSFVSVGQYEWNEREYTVNKDGKITTNIKGACMQFPLILGWAITIHKSQGLTFDNIVVHADKTFAPGQLYVALSRCTSIEGILTDNFITFDHIIPDRKLIAFFNAIKARKNIFDKTTAQNMKRNESIVIEK